jgi:hypothetical protein
MSIELVVARQCSATSPQGETFNTEVGLTAPIEKSKFDWRFTVTLGAIDKVDREFTGVDQWNAIQMGMWQIYSDLKILQDHGWKFQFFDGEESHLSCLLPPVGRNLN